MDQKTVKFLEIVTCLVVLYQQALSRGHGDLKNGDIFEGDILWDDHLEHYWDKRQKRSVNSPMGNNSQNSGNNSPEDYNNPPHKLWNYRTSDNDGSLTYTIPYEASAMTDPQSVVFIRVAMKEWNKGTCILFVPKTTETNYVSFKPGNECSSHVGMVGGQQFVTISPGCQYDSGLLMHELGHVLGLFHEHTRPDRDQYVEILQDNLIPGKFNTNFKKMTHSPSYVRSDNYDYISVMHYSKNHFSKPPYNLTTIRTLDPVYQDVIGQRSVLSAPDVEKVNFMYNCDCKIVNTTNTYTRRYWGECSYLFGLIKWRCIKEEEVTEIWSKKKCTDVISNDTD